MNVTWPLPRWYGSIIDVYTIYVPGSIPWQLHAEDTTIMLDRYANDKLRNMPVLQIAQYGTTQTRDAARKCARNLILLSFVIYITTLTVLCIVLACGMFTESY